VSATHEIQALAVWAQPRHDGDAIRAFAAAVAVAFGVETARTALAVALSPFDTRRQHAAPDDVA
jgi:hypothetical protein